MLTTQARVLACLLALVVSPSLFGSTASASSSRGFVIVIRNVPASSYATTPQACIQADKKAESKEFDPQGTTPPLEAPQDIVIQNSDGCAHEITLGGMTQTIASGKLAHWFFTKIGRYPVTDDYAKKYDWNPTPPEVIDIASVLPVTYPGQTPSHNTSQTRSSRPVSTPRATQSAAPARRTTTPSPAAVNLPTASPTPLPSFTCSPPSCFAYGTVKTHGSSLPFIATDVGVAAAIGAGFLIGRRRQRRRSTA